MKKKYMGVEYTVTEVKDGFKWEVSSGGLSGYGYDFNKSGAQQRAERWIKSAKK